jgi:hypothetical protein
VNVGTVERQSGSIIFNETAIKQLGIAEPVIGKQIVWGEDEDTTYNLKVVWCGKRLFILLRCVAK